MDDQLEVACAVYIKTLREQFDRGEVYPYPGPPWCGLSTERQERIRELLRPVLAALAESFCKGCGMQPCFCCEDCGAPPSSVCSAQCVPESECAGCHRPGEFCICP